MQWRLCRGSAEHAPNKTRPPVFAWRSRNTCFDSEDLGRSVRVGAQEGRCRLADVQIYDPAKMVTIYRECYRHWKKARTPEQGPEEEFPVLEPFLAYQSEA